MLEELLFSLRCDTASHVVVDAPLAPLTTFGVGGNADLLVVPTVVEDVVFTVQACRKHGVALRVMGAGSNLIVPDEGIRGVVLRLPSSAPVCRADGRWLEAQSEALPDGLARGLGHIVMHDDRWVVGAGVTDPALAHLAWLKGITGFEWMYDIPGSIGGAVFMNAGNSDGEMSHGLISARWVDPEGRLHDWTARQLDMSYRHTVFHDRPGLVVEATLRADTPASRESIRAEMDRIRDLRRSKFPGQLLCAGSIFKRPPGHYAGKLIEDAGLGGLRIGDAMVAHEHKGFIINMGNATASDLLQLIELVRTRVLDHSGVLLQTEVDVFGQRPFVPAPPDP